MKEVLDIRVFEKIANNRLNDEVGERINPVVRRIVAEPNSDLIKLVRQIEREAKSRGDAFLASWSISRRYTAAELQEASYFRLMPGRQVDAEIEDPSVRDESAGCPECGAGGRQVGNLIVDASKLPKNAGFCRLLSGSILISSIVLQELEKHSLDGVAFLSVYDVNSRAVVPGWRQLECLRPSIRIVPPTRTGNDPFDPDIGNNFRCSLGHIVGLNILSELSFRKVLALQSDVMFSENFSEDLRALYAPAEYW